MKKIILILICIPFVINAQNGISVDTLYSGNNTDIMFYNHSIDLSLSGAFLNPYTTNFALKNITIINADTVTATIFCNPLTHNNNFSTPYLYKFDPTSNDYEQLTQFTIIDTLEHNIEIKPFFANLNDTITVEGKWNSLSFDINSYNTFGNTINALFSNIFDYNSSGENAAFMDIQSSDSLFKENVHIVTSSTQTGFIPFYFIHINDGPLIHSIDSIAIIDSAIFINSPLSGNSTISGTITSGSGKTSGSLLNKLVVYLIDNNDTYIYTTETNSDGYFIFENVENANFKLIAGGKYNDKFSVNSGDDLSLSFKDGKLETFVSSIININDNNIEIFPNPTTNYLEFTQINQKKIIRIDIVNSKGERMKYFNNPMNKIDVSDLVKGIYFVKFNNGKQSNVYKFVID